MTATSKPTSTDALTILRVAVGLESCHVDVCDVNLSGGVTVVDATTVLKKAVGEGVSLNCPVSNVNCPGNGSDDGVLSLLGEDPNFTKAASAVAGLVHCDSAENIHLTASEWTTTLREFSADGLWLHGKAGANGKVTIELTPNCSSGVVPNFITLTGDNSGISGFKVRDFVGGVYFKGQNGTIGNMEFEDQCAGSSQNPATSIQNHATAVGSIVRDTTIKRSANKCTFDQGSNSLIAQGCSISDSVSNSLSDRGCYSLTYDNVDFERCFIPIRFPGDGTFLILNSRIGTPDANFPCRAPNLAGGDGELRVRMQDSIFDDCVAGLWLGGEDGEFVLEGNQIIKNDKRGVYAFAQADVELNHNIIKTNGGTGEGGSQDKYYGGVALKAREGAAPTVVLGDAVGSTADDCSDPSTKGCNTICNNTGMQDAIDTYDPTGAEVTFGGGAMQTHNGRGPQGGYTLLAENNYWCSSQGPDTDELFGLIDYDPWLTSDPN